MYNLREKGKIYKTYKTHKTHNALIINYEL